MVCWCVWVGFGFLIDVVGSAAKVSLHTAHQKVIYDEDNRAEFYQVSRPIQLLAQQSIMARIEKKNLIPVDKSKEVFRLSPQVQSFADRFHLCETGRFGSQPSAASCAGTLVTSDLILTAGHCAELVSDCENSYWVFNYFYEAFEKDSNSSGEGERFATITRDDVYSCKRYYYVDIEAPKWMDWGFVQLDRPVTQGHRPVLISSLQVHPSDQLMMLGFGGGIPLKIDQNLIVAKRFPHFFSGYVDSFAGSSGSGVFDEHLQLVGVLVRGQRDFNRVLYNSNWCYTINQLSNFASPNDIEEMSYAGMAIRDFCSSTNLTTTPPTPPPPPPLQTTTMRTLTTSDSIIAAETTTTPTTTPTTSTTTTSTSIKQQQSNTDKITTAKNSKTTTTTTTTTTTVTNKSGMSERERTMRLVPPQGACCGPTLCDHSNYNAPPGTIRTSTPHPKPRKALTVGLESFTDPAFSASHTHGRVKFTVFAITMTGTVSGTMAFIFWKFHQRRMPSCRTSNAVRWYQGFRPVSTQTTLT